MEDQKVQTRTSFVYQDGNGTMPPSGNKHRLIAILAGVVTALVVSAVAAFFLIGHKSSANDGAPTASGYQAKLTAVLTPVINDNVALSKALKAIDGSGSTLQAAGNAAQQTQQDNTSAHGAIAAIAVPADSQTLNQQATQALTQETGYLQAVSSTLGNSGSNSAGSLQSLSSATSAAFVPLNSVVAGGSSSIYGVDNLLSWVSGAQAAGQRNQKPNVIVQNNTTTTTVGVPTPAPANSTSSGNSGSGSSDTVSSLTPTYCSNGVYIGQNVSCGFAENVFDAVYSQWNNNGNVFPSSLSGVNSPATGQNYDLTLVSSTPSWALYQSNTGVYVSVGEYALSVY